MTTDSAKHPTHQLLVDRDELTAALRQIAAFKRRKAVLAKGSRVRLAYANGELVISMPEVTIRVAGQGTWPAEVCTDSAWVWMLAKFPPSANPVAFIYEGGKIRVGTTVVPILRVTSP